MVFTALILATIACVISSTAGQTTAEPTTAAAAQTTAAAAQTTAAAAQTTAAGGATTAAGGATTAPAGAAPPCTGLSAQACANTMGDSSCEIIFTVAPSATAVDPKCIDPAASTIVAQCRKRCMACCQDPAYACEDGDGYVLNCTTAYYNGLCTTTVPEVLNVVAAECPATCGLCMQGDCFDKNTTICTAMATPAACKNIDYYQFFMDNCQRTCDMCAAATTVPPIGTTTTAGGGACSDIASNCAQNANLCSDALYTDLMTQKCPMTCNRCGQSGGGVTCTDIHASCPTWVANGFCSSAYYTTEQKKQYCPGSCSLC